jgi:hypothetical protein
MKQCALVEVQLILASGTLPSLTSLIRRGDVSLFERGQFGLDPNVAFGDQLLMKSNSATACSSANRCSDR